MKQSVKYALLHMMFWCTYAVTWSFATVYLLDCGYNSGVIGIVAGVGAILSVIGQPILAMFTSRIVLLNSCRNIFFMKAISMVIAVLVMVNFPGWYTIAILFTLLLAIDAWIPSLLSTVAMECDNGGMNVNYGFSRGMGSIVYAIFCLMVGTVVKIFGTQSLMYIYIGIGFVVLGLIWWIEKSMHSIYAKQNESFQSEKRKKEKASFLSLFSKYPYLSWFLSASVVLFMSHNMVNVFLLNIVENVGGDSSHMGVALFIAAAVELPVMTLLAKYASRHGVAHMLVISAVFFIVKGCLTYIAWNTWMIYVEQFFQFGAFAVFTPASVYFVNQNMDQKDSAVGQALVGACTLGLGGAFGNILGGIIIEQWGLSKMILTSTGLCVAGLLFTLCMMQALRRGKKQSQTETGLM